MNHESDVPRAPSRGGSRVAESLRRWLVRGVAAVAVLVAVTAAVVLLPPAAERKGQTAPAVPAAPAAPVAPAAAATDRRPNILLITTDDMRLTDLRWMPRTRRLLQASGVTVTDFISNHPMCCPARAEILTGQYAQNNGVHSNKGPYGGYHSLGQRRNHVGSWLRSAGYHTAFVGKFVNRWELKKRPDQGWTVFDPLQGKVYSPYGMTMFNNGRPRLYPNVHTSDLMGRLTVRYVKRFSASRAPFFIWTSNVVPHGMDVDGKGVPPVPARRHRSLYPNALPPSFDSPSFNEGDVSDKPGYVQDMEMQSRQKLVALHRARIRSLRSVDDQVGAAVRALRAAGELRNTYVFFTSDNGFLLGEHRRTGKNTAYEPALKVPLLVRGPGLRPGAVRRQTYGMVDLAPTFVALSGATARRVMDGRSMMGTLRSGAPGYRHYLIQAGSKTQRWWWRGVRSSRYVYVRYADGFEELYDLARDPHQLRNVADRPGYRKVRAEYAKRLDRLRSCSGSACRTR